MPVTVSTLKVNSWIMNLTQLSDGAHTYKMVVADSAGLVSDTLKMNFVVKACSVSVLVNGQPSAMVGDTTSLLFTATITNTEQTVDSVLWIWTIGKKTDTLKTAVVANAAS
jgi:hypothetical protein